MKNFSNYTDYDKKDNLHFESKAVHGALGTEPLTGAVSMPIFQAVTYRHPALGESTGFAYSRLENPTRQELERTMAILEGGIKAFAFSSGQAANMAVFSLLNPGDHVLLSDDIYGGTFRIIGDVFGKYGIEHTYVEMDDLDAVKAAIKPNTKMFFVETPTNPMMKVADIQALSEIAKSVGALMVVDNTFLTPYFQNPLDLGADIVVHSGTKYLGGHNDTLAGFLVTNREDISERFRFLIKTTGAGLAPFDCFLIQRGIKTLGVRMDRAQENAIEIAKWLKEQDIVKKVVYPGFKEHPGYEIMKKQARGFGAMLTFELTKKEYAINILEKVRMIKYAESLGGVETLITYPMTQTHADVPEHIRKQNGITDCVLRMSVGIENVKDLLNELEEVFAEVRGE